jgi:opacity protein-like surface antigen
MKKIKLTLFFCFLLAIISPVSLAQRFSFGEYTGVNFSNLHGNLLSNKWLPKVGPNTGLFVEYSLNKSFSLQSEVDYITHYYEMKSYYKQYTGPIYNDDLIHNYILNSIDYPYYQYKYDFSFLRFPLLIKYKTPTRLQLGLGVGMFYSVLLNDDLTKAERDAAKNEDRRIYPPKHDWGYIFSADLSYPITREIRFFVTGRITSGQKVFIESVKGENGSSELGFGLKYTPKSRKDKINDYIKTSPDSSFTRCFIRPVAGLLVGWNSSSRKAGNYSAKTGSSIGAAFEYKLDKTVSLQSGVLFERKGYALSDSSLYYHRIATDDRYTEKKVDTKTELDYVTIPLNLKFSFGDPFTFYFDFGLYTGFKVNALCHGTAIEKSSSAYGYSLQKININDAVEGNYHDIDFGYQTGLGFQFPFRKNLKFDIGITYSASFSPIINKTDENSGEYSNDDVSIKNGSVALQFGLQIPISR